VVRCVFLPCAAVCPATSRNTSRRWGLRSRRPSGKSSRSIGASVKVAQTEHRKQQQKDTDHVGGAHAHGEGSLQLDVVCPPGNPLCLPSQTKKLGHGARRGPYLNGHTVDKVKRRPGGGGCEQAQVHTPASPNREYKHQPETQLLPSAYPRLPIGRLCAGPLRERAGVRDEKHITRTVTYDSPTRALSSARVCRGGPQEKRRCSTARGPRGSAWTWL
jgi:hypothetical protein